MDIAIRIFSFLFLGGVAVAGLAWIVGATSVRDRALMVAALGLAGLVGLPFLAQWLASMGLDLRIGARSRTPGVLAAMPFAVGHVALAGWLLTRRSRAERQRDEDRERDRALTRERTRLAPPDERGG